MDASTSMSTSENEMLSEGDTVIEGEDRISNLPDALLHHILSLLQTQYVIRTSVLSTRWKNLWTSVSNLDFEDAPPEYYYGLANDDTTFADFVDRVFLLRDFSNIKRFRLSCSMESTASHINTWVSAAIMRKVEDLDLRILVEEEFFLPYSLFSCDSLQILSLDILCVLKPLSNVHLPNLKILYLKGIVFPDDSSTQQFFSGCPNLEELTVVEPAWIKLNKVDIYVSKLKKLTIYFDDLCGNGLHESRVNIYAPQLTSFKYVGALSFKYCLYTVASIFDAHVNVTTLTERLEDSCFRACIVLSGLCKVGMLTISNDTIQTLSHFASLLPCLPEFSNLGILDVIGEFSNSTWDTLMVLSARIPNLQYLTVSQGFDPDAQYDANEWISKPVPQCFASSLKLIRFGRFSGTEHELKLLSLLLKHSTVLQAMSISFSKRLKENPENLASVREQVLKLDKSSLSCVITFC